MCRLCDNYNFSCVGVDYDYLCNTVTIYFPGIIGNVPKGERFKFCPVCGKELKAENFKKIKKQKRGGGKYE